MVLSPGPIYRWSSYRSASLVDCCWTQRVLFQHGWSGAIFRPTVREWLKSALNRLPTLGLESGQQQWGKHLDSSIGETAMVVVSPLLLAPGLRERNQGHGGSSQASTMLPDGSGPQSGNGAGGRGLPGTNWAFSA